MDRGGDKIDYFTDYENVKKIDAELIQAVYAVAENTEADNNARDYWVADVIVIEVDRWDGEVDNISLVFDNYQQTSQRVRYLDTLTTKYEGVEAHVIPDGEEWGIQWSERQYGFYELRDTEKDGEELKASSIRVIDHDFNSYGIYAGVVTRVDAVSGRGGYIDVELKNHPETASKIVHAYLPEDRNAVYAIDGDEAVGGLRVSETNNGDLRTGDEVIWVEKSDDNKVVYFMVVVSDEDCPENGHDHDWTTKSWLENLHAQIMAEQTDGTTTEPEQSDVDKLIAESTNTVKDPIKTKAEREAAAAMLEKLAAKLADKTITLAEAEKLTAEKNRVQGLIDAYETAMGEANEDAEEAIDELSTALDDWDDLNTVNREKKLSIIKEYAARIEEATSPEEVAKLKREASIAISEPAPEIDMEQLEEMHSYAVLNTNVEVVWGQSGNKTSGSGNTYDKAKDVFLLNPEDLVIITEDTTDEDVLKALISWYYSAGQNEVTGSADNGWSITKTSDNSTVTFTNLTEILTAIFENDSDYDGCTSFAIVPLALGGDNGPLIQTVVRNNADPVYQCLGLVNGSDTTTMFNLDMTDVIEALNA